MVTIVTVPPIMVLVDTNLFKHSRRLHHHKVISSGALFLEQCADASGLTQRACSKVGVSHISEWGVARSLVIHKHFWA